MITKKFIKQALIMLGLMVGAITLLSVIPTASAAIIGSGDLPSNLGEATGGESSLRAIIVKVINYFLGFLGLIAVIMIIYGGFTYMTAAGKQEAVDSAKKTILYAIVGIVIILLSFAIVNTIVGVAADGGTTTATPAPAAVTTTAPAL
jgi:hypothetical protein